MLAALPFAALAFVLVLLLTPKLAELAWRAGFRGVDLHKEHKPELPEQGGVAVVLGFIISALLYAGMMHASPKFYVALLAFAAVSALGYYDRIRRLSAIEKVAYLTVIGLVLLPFVEDTRVLGVELGALYLVCVPLAFMCACNFTNMLAGFNGLEIGTGAIASLGIAAAALLKGEQESFAIALILSASLLAFLRYNRYPAKVFPGDVATLAIGAALFSAIVFGKLEVEGAVVFLPYAVDAALKFFTAGVMTRESQKPTLVRGGLLLVPEGSNLSLPRVFLRLRPMREPQVVALVWATELLCSAAAAALAALL